MTEKDFYTCIMDFCEELEKDYDFAQEGRCKHNKEMRMAKIEELLLDIKSEDASTQPYSRVKLCYAYFRVLCEKFKDTNGIDFEELADCIAAVMSDIEYVAAHDSGYYADHQKIYRINYRDNISCIIDAIAGYLPEEYMRRFMNSVVAIECNKEQLYNLVNYFRCVIQRYARADDYQLVVDYGRWFMDVYKEKAWCCTATGVDDFVDTVDEIHIDIDVAYRELSLRDEEHEKIMVDVRAREAETPQERQNRKRAECYYEAERSRAQGDMDGYRGNMSAAGDIGR